MVDTLPPQPQTVRRLPASGNAALAASALIQAALGIEFLLSGLNKFADPNFLADFGGFVRSSPATSRGVLSRLIQGLVLPNLALFGSLIKFTELILGIVLLVGAAEIARRRFQGHFARQYGYEAPVALIAALAGLGAASLVILDLLAQRWCLSDDSARARVYVRHPGGTPYRPARSGRRLAGNGPVPGPLTQHPLTLTRYPARSSSGELGLH